MEIKRCLVTGGTGFIGRVLCRRLQLENIFVRTLLRREAEGPWQESVIYNLNNIEYSSEDKSISQAVEGIDTLFHTAGIAHAGRTTPFSKEDYQRVNVKATEQLLKEACQAGVKRFIYFSSVKVLSDETDPYTDSKRAAEKIVSAMGKTHNIHVVILRPVLVYGPMVKSNLAHMIRNIDRGTFPPLPETHNQRTLVSIEDLVDAALKVALNLNTHGKSYVVTDGRYYSTKQLYDAIRAALGLPERTWGLPLSFLKIAAKMSDCLQNLSGKKLPFNSEVLEKLLGSSKYSSDALQKELDWKPKLDFYQALPEIIKSLK